MVSGVRSDFLCILQFSLFVLCLNTPHSQIARLGGFSNRVILPVHPEHRHGLEDLIDPALQLLKGDRGDLFRQRVAAEQALQCVEEALDAVALGMTLDAITVSIEGAIEALAELTGENVSEAVVDGVFHRFCVGK